ncbi:MAG: PEGA domain-containing protein, partial [Proteobacteria bacterium]|nr:PEGA domain-containing protein [Pseudomonadota bacterium]
KEACAQARVKLTELVFGASYQIHQNLIRSSEGVQHLQDISTNSGQVVFRGTTEKITEQDGIIQCELGYPELEAEKEIKRLASVQGNKEITVTELGDAENVRAGEIEFVTVPADVPVYIDNERWGTTPLRLYGKVSPGKHRLRLDHPGYKPIEQEFELQDLGKIKIEKILELATAKIRLETAPSHAEIYIDGELKGYSPKEISIVANKPVKIVISHPSTGEYSQELEMQRDENRSLAISLPSKPALVSFNVISTEGITIEIDNEVKKYKPNEWISTSAGDHEFVIRSHGNSPKRIFASVKGGERRAFPSIKLSKVPSLSVDSEPNGARVLLGNELIGVTPLKGTEILKPAGRYKLEFQKDGFSAVEQYVELQEAAEAIVPKVKMSSLSKLTVKVNVAVKAIVELNGPVQKYAMGSNVVFDHLPSGLYSLKVAVSGHQTFQRKLELEPGETKVIEKDLFEDSETPKVFFGLPAEYTRSLGNSKMGSGFLMGVSMGVQMISVFKKKDLGLEVQALFEGFGNERSGSTAGSGSRIRCGMPLFIVETIYVAPTWTTGLYNSQKFVGAQIGTRSWLLNLGALKAGIDFRVGYQRSIGSGSSPSGPGGVTTGLAINLGW